jgi:hypothetical protein
LALENTLAAIAINTSPVRGQPGQVALENSFSIIWVEKFNPITRKSSFNF